MLKLRMFYLFTRDYSTQEGESKRERVGKRVFMRRKEKSLLKFNLDLLSFPPSQRNKIFLNATSKTFHLK